MQRHRHGIQSSPPRRVSLGQRRARGTSDKHTSIIAIESLEGQPSKAYQSNEQSRISCTRCLEYHNQCEGRQATAGMTRKPLEAIGSTRKVPEAARIKAPGTNVSHQNATDITGSHWRRQQPPEATGKPRRWRQTPPLQQSLSTSVRLFAADARRPTRLRSEVIIPSDVLLLGEALRAD